MLLPESAAALACESFRTACEYEIALDSRADGRLGRHPRLLRLGRGVSAPACGTRLDVPGAVYAANSLGACHQLDFREQVFAFLTESTPAQRDF